MQTDLNFMRFAIRLARHGYGAMSPNPFVGAVLVKSGKIIGRGWHRRAGRRTRKSRRSATPKSAATSRVARRFTSRSNRVAPRVAPRLAQKQSSRRE